MQFICLDNLYKSIQFYIYYYDRQLHIYIYNIYKARLLIVIRQNSAWYYVAIIDYIPQLITVFQDKIQLFDRLHSYVY